MKDIFIILMALFLLAQAGCSGRMEADGEKNTYSIIGSRLKYDTSLPVNGGEPISIQFWTQVDYEDLYRSAVSDYMELHPNVSIELVPASFKDHFAKVSVALSAGIGPDIFHMHNSYTDDLLPHMEPYPDESISYESLLDDFAQVRQHMVNGNIHFIDTGFMTGSIYYNKEIWENEGLTEKDFPRTWEELARLALKLTEYGEEGEILRAGFNPNGQGFELFTAMNLQKGQRLFSENDLKTPVLNSAESRETMAFLRSLYEKPNVVDINTPLFHESFGTGSSAMIYAWGWAINWLEKNFPSADFGTFPTPYWEDAPAPEVMDRNNRESSMAVSKYSSEAKKAAAFDFILFFLASDAYLEEINRQMGTIPSKKNLAEKFGAESGDLYYSFFSIMDSTVWPGLYPAEYERRIIEDLIDPVIIDGEAIDRSLDEVQRKLEPYMLRSGFLSME